MGYRFAVVLVAVASAAVAAAAIAAAAIAGPARWQVRAAPAPTRASQMFDDPALPGTPEAAEIAAHGYVRQEFFLSGTANVYGYDATGRAAVEKSGIPYTTRVVVVRPRDAARFSGVVQLNPFHPLMGQGTWTYLKSYLLAHGDAYVGVMTGADDNTRKAPPTTPPLMAPAILEWFDPVRYAPVRWPDDDGVRWDVFGQTARAVRAAGSPLLGGLRVRQVHADGLSFTGSFLRTWINEGFHDRYRMANGRPLIDGYLIEISSSSYASGYVPINGHSPNLAPEDPRRRNRAIDVPVIELMSENEAVTNRDPQTPDRDGGPGAHRLYEVPGLTHGGGRPGGPSIITLQLRARGQQPPLPPRRDACSMGTTDVDMSHFAHAALAALHIWVTQGKAPARVPRMAVDPRTWQGVKDAEGNTLGGLRPAQLSVPLASYGDPGCNPPARSIGSAMMDMRRTPLSPATLAKLYPGGRAEYLRRFDAAADDLARRGLLLAADAAVEKAEARKRAEAAFSP